ncbi:hypothetical protein BDQ17DRAFT_1376184 [Cyathus striatus]|nr:hypothetical protein BDQ17DRAFT_1376184 [Cyathus striatus]
MDLFNAASHFVIQNSTFISETKKYYVKKIYQQPIRQTPSARAEGSRKRLYPHKSLLSNFRRIPTGDMIVIERIKTPMPVDSISYDCIVEVVGENKKRTARIYHGQSGYTRFRKELDILAKLWSHPSIFQVFGICEVKDTIGIVFHDDGIRQRQGKYALSLKPLHRAAFYIKYILEYHDTIKYLRTNIRRILHGFILDDKLCEHEGAYTYVTDFYVDSYGNLKAILSVHNPYIPDGFGYGYIVGSFTSQNIPQLSGSDLGVIQSILKNDDITSPIRFRIIEVTLHRAFLTVKVETMTRNRFECYLDCSVMILNNNLHPYVAGHFKVVHQHDFKRKTTWQIQRNKIFQKHQVRVGELTRFQLTNESITPEVCKKVYHQQIQVHGCCEILDDAYHTSWLAQVPHILEGCGFLAANDPFGLGMVSRVDITLDINILFPPLIGLMENSPQRDVYLFISDPEIDKVNGKVYPPHVYWSLDRSGTKPLSEYFATSNGLTISNIRLNPWVSYWEKFYYEALRDFYNACGIHVSDVFSLLCLPELTSGLRAESFIKSSSYIEEIDGIDYYKTKNEFRISQELPRYLIRRNNITIDVTKKTKPTDQYIMKIESPDISSLAWIGITSLEDCFGILSTVYETKYVQAIRRKNYHQYLCEHELRCRKEDEWEEITHTELQDDLDKSIGNIDSSTGIGNSDEEELDRFEELLVDKGAYRKSS